MDDYRLRRDIDKFKYFLDGFEQVLSNKYGIDNLDIDALFSNFYDISQVDELIASIVSDNRGIVSIEKTSTEGLVDTYTITYTDDTTSTFTVTNGSGASITVDSSLSDNSTNPVQNKVLKGVLDGKASSTHPHTVSDISDFPAIVDNLTTDDATKILSAKQGKVLNDLIGDAISYINQ